MANKDWRNIPNFSMSGWTFLVWTIAVLIFGVTLGNLLRYLIAG